jgi:alpha-tubulin suppressor-like RCC1 family protein
MLILAASAGLRSAEFRIDDVLWQNGRAEVSFAKEPAFYYILWRGDEPTEIRLATDLALGSVTPNSLADTNATNAARFYRVEKVPMTSVRDTDDDGINDPWELLYRHSGAALNGQDPEEDHNANSVPDRLDALRESLREGGVRSRPVLAAGYYHSLAVKRDGTLWGWGDNIAGRLGVSGFTETSSPVQISPETNWVAVSVNEPMSLGLRSDGSLWTWGREGYSGSILPPVQIGVGMKWIGLPKAWSSQSPTLLREDGTRWQISGTYSNLVQMDAATDWAAVADGGASQHWAIKIDGTLWSGVSIFDTNQSWSAITLGLYHALAVRTDGTLWAWTIGCCNNEGQLGLGSYASPSTPTQAGTDTWAAAAAGLYSSAGIKSDGSLWWWGLNQGFDPSSGDLVRTNAPARLGTNTDWVAVSIDAHILALRADGTVWTFGYNEGGRLGNGTPAFVKEPAQVGGDPDWIEVATGTRFSFGLKTNGTLWAWGANRYGVLGVGEFAYGSSPRQVPGSNWISVSAGTDHTVALQSDGSLWVWGRFSYGDAAPGELSTNLPTRLGSDLDWRKISAGAQHSLAIKNNRTLWAWGRNVNGELGTGGFSQNSPVQVGSLFWTNIAAGHYSSLGVASGGTLYKWGQAIGSVFGSQQPSQICCSSDWADVALAKSHITSAHALALQRNGTLWGWGASFNGQLGTNGSVGQPAQIGASTNWAQIAVGDHFSSARQRDGTLWMAGENFYGQLGLGHRIDTNLFTPVGADTNWTSVAAGTSHVLALKADRTLWAWGDNSFGQCAQPALFEPMPVAGTNWGQPQ